MDALPQKFIDDLCYITENDILEVSSPQWKAVSSKHAERRRFYLFLKSERKNELRYAFVNVTQGQTIALNTQCFPFREVAAMESRHFWFLGICLKEAVPGERDGFPISMEEFQDVILPFARRRLYYQGMSCLTLMTPNQALQNLVLGVYEGTCHFKRLFLTYTSKSTMTFLKFQIAHNSRLTDVYLEGRWPESLLPLVHKMVVAKNVGCDIANTTVDLTFAFVQDLIENFKTKGTRCKLNAHCALNRQDIETLARLTELKMLKREPYYKYVHKQRERFHLVVKFEGTLLTIYSVRG